MEYFREESTASVGLVGVVKLLVESVFESPDEPASLLKLAPPVVSTTQTEYAEPPVTEGGVEKLIVFQPVTVGVPPEAVTPLASIVRPVFSTIKPLAAAPKAET